MPVVLAAIDGPAAAPSVLDAARAMSVVFGASLRAVHVLGPTTLQEDEVALALADRAHVPLTVLTGDPVDEIVHAAGREDVELVVVGAREHPDGPEPAGHVALGIAERTSKPVLVVPLGSQLRAGTGRIARALVPLEGTPESADAIAACMCVLADAGVELVAVHVFDDDVPRFWDEPAHAVDAYVDEFSARWCRQPDVDIRLRSGSAPATMMEVAEAENVDLIALAWSQDMAPGHARMIRSAVAGTTLPVLLVPVADGTEPQVVAGSTKP